MGTFANDIQSPYKSTLKAESNSHRMKTPQFPLNLESTEQMNFVDSLNMQEQLHEFQMESSSKSGDDVSKQRDNDGHKSKDFYKSLLIKFEEFEGESGSQRGSDLNRKTSERVSDRIYERVESSENKQESP